MTGEQQDKMIDKIIDEFKGYAMIGNIVHQKDWYDLAEDIVKLFALMLATLIHLITQMTSTRLSG